MTRFVLTFVIALLVVGGFVAGGATFIFASHHEVIATLLALGAALGPWALAALLALAMEIADSLRELVRRVDE